MITKTSRLARATAIFALAYSCLIPQASAAGFLCTATGASLVPGQRIHIRCSNAQSGISYFAYGTADQNDVSRLLALGSAAVISGRQIFIAYDPNDTSGSAIGCSINDCRLIQYVELQ